MIMWTPSIGIAAAALLVVSGICPAPASPMQDQPPGSDSVLTTGTADPKPVLVIRDPLPAGEEWTKPDIDAVAANTTLDRFHEAAAKGDFDAYFAPWTSESVFIGTDATEHWVGDQFKDFAKPIFAKGKGWTYKPRNRHITLIAKGTVAVFDELLDNAKLGVCRGSGVLEKRGEDWKILQYNLSIPIPNDAAQDVVARIRGPQPAPSAPTSPNSPASAPK